MRGDITQYLVGGMLCRCGVNVQVCNSAIPTSKLPVFPVSCFLFPVSCFLREGTGLKDDAMVLRGCEFLHSIGSLVYFSPRLYPKLGLDDLIVRSFLMCSSFLFLFLFFIGPPLLKARSWRSLFVPILPLPSLLSLISSSSGDITSMGN
jgi:hypothetical protein